MALKKFVEIKGWDSLDAFFEKRVEGVHMACENFDRVFCRCGETHSSEGGIVHKCPKCGNTDFIEYGNDVYNYEVPSKVRYTDDTTYAPFKYIINKNKLSGTRDANRTAIEFTFEVIPKYEFTKDDIKDLEPSPATPSRSYYYRCYDDDKGVPAELIKKWDYYEENAELANEFYEEVSVDTLKTVLNIKKIFKDVLDDDLTKQYPSLSKSVIRQLISSSKDISKIPVGPNLKFYLDMLGIDKDFYSIYDYTERKNDGGYNGIFRNSYRRGYGSSSQPIYKEIQEFKKKKNVGFEILKPYIMNGILALDESIGLCDNIADMYSDNPEFNFLNWDSPYRTDTRWGRSSTPPKRDFKTDFPEEVMDLFPVYVKENISVKKNSNLCECFINDVNTLREMKIAITADNLKVKTMNYYLNKQRLADTYKLPPDKMQVFIDWFEKNPLKAVSLIENRRKLTKKQLDNFIKIMSED